MAVAAGAKAPKSADGVFEGGGVKGLALVGGLLEFADYGYTDWVKVAGTSAGAIVAAYLATGHTAEQAEALLEATDFATFEDFGPGGLLIGGIADLVAHHGLAHGAVFHDWFNRAVGGRTFADVREAGRTLKLIASDITRHQMLVLPEDLRHYRHPKSSRPIDPDSVLIADAVRMSMSIPYFFTPITLVDVESGEASTIVDGGVVSNFPVWIFDVDRDAQRPTFGFRLVGGTGAGGGYARAFEHLGWEVRMAVNLFDTASDAFDTEFATHSTAVRTCQLDANGIGTTDFTLTKEQKQTLVDLGREGARTFLSGFATSAYVNSFGHGLVDPVQRPRV
jgi:NTE family protein